MFLNYILDFFFLNKLQVIGFQLKDDSRSSDHVEVLFGGDSECTSSSRFPSESFVRFAGSGDNSDLVSDQVSGVETNTELSDHTNVGSGRESFHEGFGSGSGDGTQVVDHFLSVHTNTGIFKSKGIVGSVRDNLNSKVGFLGHLAGIGVSDRSVSDFIKSIRSVRN